MNKQGPNGISWTDFTWSPVTGCYHGCPYCYARRMAKRVGYSGCWEDDAPWRQSHWQGKPVYIAPDRPLAFPFGFAPTFYPARLAEPAKVRKPSKIFVVSAGDLFGEWMPGEWVAQVMQVVRANPRHTFQFLTKNPKRLADLNPWPGNAWVGATATCWSDMERVLPELAKVEAPVRFVSAEPLLGPLYGGEDPFRGWEALSWLILGAMTGPGAEDEEPPVWWGEQAMDAATRHGIAVWAKDSLPWSYESKRPKEWPG